MHRVVGGVVVVVVGESVRVANRVKPRRVTVDASALVELADVGAIGTVDDSAVDRGAPFVVGAKELVAVVRLLRASGRPPKSTPTFFAQSAIFASSAWQTGLAAFAASAQ